MPSNNPPEEENTSLVGAGYVFYVLGLTLLYYSISAIPAYFCLKYIPDWNTGKYIQTFNKFIFQGHKLSKTCFIEGILSKRHIFLLENLFFI